jgi:hypothetical protein
MAVRQEDRTEEARHPRGTIAERASMSRELSRERGRWSTRLVKKKVARKRRYERIALPKGMSVAWYGGGRQQVSRVKTLGMGGVFLCGSHTLAIGTELMLVFEVPGGIFQAEGVVRNIVSGEGMGVEFVKMNPQGQLLLEQLLKRLLR